MKKGKLLSAIMALAFTLCSTSTSLVKAESGEEKVFQLQDQTSAIDSIYTYGGPVDISIGDEEKIIEMLKKEGKISNDASYKEAYKLYREYMSKAAKSNKNIKLSKMERDLKAKQNQKVQKYIFEQSKPDANPKKVNVLVLLVEYQDYKHNSITSEETNMHYKNYDKKHFEDMIFGDNGYKGPNGENLISMKQYYKEQSGGSLLIEGKVAGWYTAPKDAAYYGEEVGSNHDLRPRNLIAHTLMEAAKDPNLNLADFDSEDIYDLDGDGNYNEPDGIIDHVMVIHAGMGQEAGGGNLGTNAIWSHRWNLGGLFEIPGTNMKAYDYTIEPEDGAAGVFAHEFGHDLGLPDEYDTEYTSEYSEPISNWSIMSSGSWAGKIPGTEPTGFSPYARQFFQGVYGGNWQKQVVIDYDRLSKAGARIDLKQASEEGQVVRINLPDKKNIMVNPVSGENVYWGGSGKDGTSILNSMATKVDLTNATNPILNFKAWYDIEFGWDFASVQAREVGSSEWTYLEGNITTTEHDLEAVVVVPHGITGTSIGWTTGTFDLSEFKGKNIELKFEYATDKYTFGTGFYVDDISINDGNKIIASDNVEGKALFNLNGFEVNKGYALSNHYYLIEWRNHHGVDKGLASINAVGQTFAYDPGLVVWYVDDFYTDNWTGEHPGNGYLGVVDADTSSLKWKFNDGTELAASNKYQMRDAAFSKNKGSELKIDLSSIYGRILEDNHQSKENRFSDSGEYFNIEIPELGRNIPKLGLSIQIQQQLKDNSGVSISIKK